jgi:putative SOS response-associated peptidase YedK
MCGRYVLAAQKKAERAFNLGRTNWEFEVRYNVAPTDNVPVVRMYHGERVGTMMRWGLVPWFANGEPPKYSTINARVESLATAAAFRGPWERGRRCILPASGFYEWQVDENGRKQPFFIHLADQEIFGFAGLYDRSVGPDGTDIRSCTIITMPANELVSRIHNSKRRMPAILRAEDHEAWLTGTRDDAKAALVPYPSELMVAYRVGPRVNSTKNDDASLIEPLQQQAADQDAG